MLKNNDVRPGTMITYDKIGGMRIQIGRTFDIPLDILHDMQNQTVAVDPLRSKRSQDLRAPVAELRGKKDKFQQNDGNKKSDPEYRIKHDQ